MSRDAAGFGSTSKKRTRSGWASRPSTASSRSGGKPGRVATASRVRASTSSGSFHVENSQNWSAPITNSGSSNGSARSSSIVHGCGSRRTSSSGKAARASSSLASAGASTPLCPGAAVTSTTSRSSPKCAFAARATSTWPRCGGSNAPP